MSRTKTINGLTVGYNYMLKKFYVTNKSYTTYRENIDDILNVIEVAGVGGMTGVRQQVEKLARDYEELYEISYTLSSTGSYISSLIFNDYTDYCIILDMPKGKVYIKNSNIVLDLSLNESSRSHVDVLCEYYRETLGLQIDHDNPDTFGQIYDMFIYPYYDSNSSVSVYNLLDTVNNLDSEKNPTHYSNTIANNNFDKKALAEYNATLNPYNTYTPSSPISIIKTDTEYNSITALNTIPSALVSGDKVRLSNATTYGSGYSYSADGDYTIKTVEGNVIITEETIRSNYNYNFRTAQLQKASNCMVIKSIDRDTSTITILGEEDIRTTTPYSLTIPGNYEVGTIIHISGTQHEIDGEQVSCDGQYTIAALNRETNTIQVQELFPTNYTNTNLSTTCIVGKRVSLGDIEKVENKQIYFYDTIPTGITTSDFVFYNTTRYSITSTTPRTITVSEDIDNFTNNFALLKELIPDTDMLINVTSTTNETVFPITSFMLNNFTDLQEYIGLLPNLSVPPIEVYNRINKEIDTQITLDEEHYIYVYNTEGQLLTTITHLNYKGIMNPSEL